MSRSSQLQVLEAQYDALKQKDRLQERYQETHGTDEKAEEPAQEHGLEPRLQDTTKVVPQVQCLGHTSALSCWAHPLAAGLPSLFLQLPCWRKQKSALFWISGSTSFTS